MGMELRPYQREAVDSVFKEWCEEHHSKTLLVLPTGTGKTIVFCKITERCVRGGERVLILAHRGELLEQAAEKLEKATGLKCAVEKAEQTCKSTWYRAVVGSVQTLSRDKRLEQLGHDFFDTIIIDEAHHALSESYQHILSYFNNAKVLGVTATPDRGDRRNLGQYFDSIAYEYTLPQAIKEKYLTPIKAQTIPLDIDISNISIQAGDYKTSEIGTALDPYLPAIADTMQEYAGERKTVVFLPLIKTSQKFCDLLNKRGFKAAEVNGNSDDRAKILSDFSAGKYNVLCNSMLLTEGWDCPDVDCVIVLRPTKVRSLYCQMVGRGTRLAPNKDYLLILDYLWHTGRHDLCQPACLICQSDEVSKRATEILKDSEEPMDIEAVEKEAEEDVIAQREKALAEQLAAQRYKKQKLVDPLQFEMSIQAEDLSGYTPSFGWEMSPPTTKQISTLEKYGIFADEIDNSGKAKLLLDRLAKRRSAGLATPKQIRFLENRGFLHVGTWSLDTAKKLINRIAANNWRVPRDINPGEYNPQKAEETGVFEWEA